MSNTTEKEKSFVVTRTKICMLYNLEIDDNAGKIRIDKSKGLLRN